jgi:hypothetical protein
VHRVAADVDGVPVWFETTDHALNPAPEALASAFLLPALHHRARLRVADPLDPLWLENVGRLLEVLRRWWRYPVWMPEAPATVPQPSKSGFRSGRALMFSGGVDSFYSLLASTETPDRLVTVQGFDVGLDDDVRMADVEATLRAVGRDRGLRTVVLRTNLRSHPLLRETPWERAHGGALIAVGHALGATVSEVLISSSIARNRDRSWGSHWLTDPLYSSSRVRFRQVGSEYRRIEKLRHLVNEPLVQHHLRVCWVNRSPSGNCSRCAKCLITRLVLADCGSLDAFPGFDGIATLARDLDRLPRYGDTLRALTELAQSPRLEPDVRRAVQELLRRSRHAVRPDVRARRAMLKKLLLWSGWRP